MGIRKGKMKDLDLTYALMRLNGEFLLTPLINISWGPGEFQINVGWLFWVFSLTTQEMMVIPRPRVENDSNLGNDQ